MTSCRNNSCTHPGCRKDGSHRILQQGSLGSFHKAAVKIWSAILVSVSKILPFEQTFAPFMPAVRYKEETREQSDNCDDEDV